MVYVQALGSPRANAPETLANRQRGRVSLPDETTLFPASDSCCQDSFANIAAIAYSVSKQISTSRFAGMNMQHTLSRR